MPTRLYPIDPDLAGTLARRRRALGLSQNALALAAGLTEASVAKYETLRCPIPPDRCAAIERVLNNADQIQRVAS
jgi:transcriptional regulator with XRE-family HTH domain